MADVPAAMAVLGEPGWALLVEAGLAFDEARGDALRAAAALARRRPAAPAAHRAAALELVAEGERFARKALGSMARTRALDVLADGRSGAAERALAHAALDERMLAPAGAAEQATSAEVARWHASHVGPDDRVVEIGCGAGGDSLALAARARNLIAADADPVRAACCHVNLASHGRSNARAVQGDGLAVLEADGRDADVVFADPDRRPDGERSLDPEAWRPPLSRLAALARDGRRVLVKAAPSLDADAAPRGFDVTYVECGGECAEAFLASAAAGGPRRVRAVRTADGAVLEGDRGDAPVAAALPAPGDAILVPGPAAIRARLLAELCARHGLALAGDGIAFLTGPPGASSPWLREHVVVEAADVSGVREALRRHGARDARIHVRGLPAAAADLGAAWRRGLDRGGGGPVLDVFVARFGPRLVGRPAAVIARG